MVQVNFPHAWTLQIDTTCSTAVNRRFKEPIPNVQLYMPVIRSSLDLWQYEGVALLQQLNKKKCKAQGTITEYFKSMYFFPAITYKTSLDMCYDTRSL